MCKAKFRVGDTARIKLGRNTKNGAFSNPFQNYRIRYSESVQVGENPKNTRVLYILNTKEPVGYFSFELYHISKSRK